MHIARGARNWLASQKYSKNPKGNWLARQKGNLWDNLEHLEELSEENLDTDEQEYDQEEIAPHHRTKQGEQERAPVYTRQTMGTD